MKQKDTIALLTTLSKNPQQMNKRHLKRIYALLIACGHFPVCPWCKTPIYNINDFTWDHIIPKSHGGTDNLDNLQPMHKHCNNAAKNDTVYQEEYEYNITENLQETVLSTRAFVYRKQVAEIKRKKAKYNNKKR
jgi:hypothetical protein